MWSVKSLCVNTFHVYHDHHYRGRHSLTVRICRFYHSILSSIPDLGDSVYMIKTRNILIFGRNLFLKCNHAVKFLQQWSKLTFPMSRYFRLVCVRAGCIVFVAVDSLIASEIMYGELSSPALILRRLYSLPST